MAKVDASPPLVNLTGLWGAFATPSLGIKTPLLAVSNVPTEGAEWMEAVQPPRLDAPDLDIDSIALYVAALATTLTSLHIAADIEGIENNKLQKKADFDRAQEQQRVADQKAKDAAEAAKKAMILEWLSAVAAIIGSVLAVAGAIAVTGGLAVGLAIAGVLMAVQALSNTAIKQAQADGKKITTTDALGKEHQLSLSWGLAVEMDQARAVASGNILRKDEKGNVIDASGKIMTKEEVQAAFDKNPFTRILSKEEMAKEVLASTLTIEIGIAVAMIACGVRSMVTAGKNAAKAAEKAAESGGKSVRLGIEASAKTWARFGRWSEGLSAATEVVGAVGEIVVGGYGVEGAHLQAQSSNAQAEQFYYEKKMKAAMTAIRTLQDACKALVKALNDTYEAMSQQVKELDELRVSIARKINQKTS